MDFVGLTGWYLYCKRWASSKPNLLNVALTRARDRIYTIGDRDLWANKPCFSQASVLLERKK